MISNNIDILDARDNTLVPFNRQSPYSIGALEVTPDCFLAIKLKCAVDAVLPVYLKTVSISDKAENSVDIVFAAADGALVGMCVLKADKHTTADTEFKDYSGALIYSDSRMLFPVGHVVYRPDIPGTLYNAAYAALNKTVDCGTALELLPECVGLRYPLSYIRVSVNGEETDTAELDVKGRLEMTVGEGAVKFNADDHDLKMLNNNGSVVDMPKRKNGIQYAKVVGENKDGEERVLFMDAVNGDVLLEPGTYSDIRVRTGQTEIDIIGTANA